MTSLTRCPSSTFRYVSLAFLLLITVVLSGRYLIGCHAYLTLSAVPAGITLADCIDTNVLTQEGIRCVKSKVLLEKYRTTVCVHDVKKDRDVSGLLIASGIWEEHLVTRFVRILSAHPRYAFFDIGANLGVYTMFAAAAGCLNIISIECFQPNFDRIRRAIQHEGVQKRVVLVPRALYNQSNVYVSLRANIQNNIGSQRLSNEVTFNPNNPLVVKTIRFDDLLWIVHQRRITEAVIKIDIETSEHFLCETGRMMFARINIPLVMMEWVNVQKNQSKSRSHSNLFHCSTLLAVRRRLVSNASDTRSWSLEKSRYSLDQEELRILMPKRQLNASCFSKVLYWEKWFSASIDCLTVLQKWEKKKIFVFEWCWAFHSRVHACDFLCCDFESCSGRRCRFGCWAERWSTNWYGVSVGVKCRLKILFSSLSSSRSLIIPIISKHSSSSARVRNDTQRVLLVVPDFGMYIRPMAGRPTSIRHWIELTERFSSARNNNGV